VSADKLTSRETAPDPKPPVDLESLARQMTPARVFAQRTGAALTTKDWLGLRADHAFARDAVFEGLDLERDFGPQRIRDYGLFEVRSQAPDRSTYLLDPGKGRMLDPQARDRIQAECPRGPDLQMALGDGLSATAVRLHGPRLLDAIWAGALERGWTLGRPFLVHQARVGLLNEIGLAIAPRVALLLIGERPGLSAADSLSAYMAYQPKTTDTDAQRNLVANIHPRGVPLAQATQRILNLVAALMQAQKSGVEVKEPGLTLEFGKPGPLCEKPLAFDEN